MQYLVGEKLQKSPYSLNWQNLAVFKILGRKSKLSTFLGPDGTRFARFHFKAQKSLNFQGPPLPTAIIMGVARIKIIMSRAIETTSTLKGLSHEIDLKKFT